MAAVSTTPDPVFDLPSLCLAITEHAPLPIAMVEGATHIVRYANPAFCRLMDEPAEKLIGKPLSELLPEKDECITLLDRVFRARRAESHIEQDDSKLHPVFWSYTMWPVLQDEGLVGVMLQVTETAEVHGKTLAMNEALMLGSIRQHELAEAAEKLNTQLRVEVASRERIAAELSEKARLLDLTFDAIIVRGVEGEIRYWNNGAEELYGWSQEEALGKISHLLLQTEFPTPLAEITEVLHRTGRWIGELVHTKRDGQRITVLARKTLDRDSEGNPAAVLQNITDITARHELEGMLVARATDLARADRSKDEFLAMLAHELRNPLAPLRNAAEILRTTGAGAEACAEAQSILVRQIENMARMIDDLLDVSRITEGKVELRKQVVLLESVLTAAANVARPGIDARRQKLAIQVPAEPIYLHADATRLEQVFGNLLGNARKYSAPGCQITLSVERTSPEAPEQEAIVRVRDQGIGIAPELLPRIFDLFVQATRASDRAHGGLGIGLTLVHQLVKLHGGSVEARSDGLGHGSEFTVRLPVLPGPLPVPLPTAPAPARDIPCRMLIVDDNQDSARSMSTLQRLRGHETRTAFTGLEALVVAADFEPEVVLMDIGLPGMDGYEVARRLRAMPALAGAFLVAMTGYGSDEDRAAGKDADFDEYLVKPVDLDVLREWLRSRIGESSEQL
jgi:two-component system CheB/CheR fusion protein